MAVHLDAYTMAEEAIEEYLQASAICLTTRKSDGGCLGYASTLLLFCVIDAFGAFLRGDSVKIDGIGQKITKGEPFRVLNHGIFGLNLAGDQIKLLEKSYRNALAHHAIIEVGASLIQTSGTRPQVPFTFTSNKIHVINVDSFYELVAKAWQQFDRIRIQSWAEQRRTS